MSFLLLLEKQNVKDKKNKGLKNAVKAIIIKDGKIAVIQKAEDNKIYYSEFDLSTLSSLDEVDIVYNQEISNFLSELVSKKHPNLHHVIPISIEITILIGVAIFGVQTELGSNEGKWVASSMLFAMGMQNALVTKISKSTVRTTHLTGLFTDLGIELSQLFFYKKPEERKRLKKRKRSISFIFR